MIHSLRYHGIVIGSLLFALSGMARQKTERGESDGLKEPCAQVMIVALGSKPARRFKMIDGEDAPVMLLPRPGEVPPSKLYYRGNPASGSKLEWVSFRLPFNSPSFMRDITPGKPLTLYRKLADHKGYEKYITIPAVQRGSRRVCFLLPSSKGPKPWHRPPLVRSITLDAEGVRGRQLILKNLSKFTVTHAFGNTVVKLQPTKAVSYRRPNMDRLCRIAAQYGTQKKIIYNTAIRLNKGNHLHLIAFYDANPRTNNGRSVAVYRTTIPMVDVVPEPMEQGEGERENK